MIDINSGYSGPSNDIEVSNEDLLKAIHASERTQQITPIQYSKPVVPTSQTDQILMNNTQRYDFLKTYVFNWRNDKQ